MTDLNLGAVLCYVEGCWAYFTTKELDKQWGDDWNDAPYEHNAGTPYAYREYNKDRGEKPWEIYQIAWVADLEDPAFGLQNSWVTVEQINRGKVPWLKTPDYYNPGTMIFAGTTLLDFVVLVKELGGQTYVRFPHALIEGDK